MATNIDIPVQKVSDFELFERFVKTSKEYGEGITTITFQTLVGEALAHNKVQDNNIDSLPKRIASLLNENSILL